MTTEKFSIRKRIKSFQYAFRGLFILFQKEHNARIHLIAAIITITLGMLFDIRACEWAVIIFAIVLVIGAELFNSALEQLADAVTKDLHPAIRNAKDMAAGAVLILALGAVVIGLIVFIPYFIKFFINV